MLSFLLQAAVPQPHTLTGDFRTHPNFHSRFLASNRTVLVYLPPSYRKQPDRRYPVLYLHDGQNLFDGATSFIPGHEWRVDETAESLIAAGSIEPLIIVGIYNAGNDRMDEYTPTRDARIGAGGQADLYGRMLAEELKPFIDLRYRTLPGASDTGIGGSSLGGLVSLYLALQHPEIYGKVAAVSPSLWWDDGDILRRVGDLSSKPALRVWLDTGTDEGKNPHKTVTEARKLRDDLIEKGWTLGVDLHYEEAAGAGHNENAWAARVPQVLRFLFPPR